jgi:hypothetical protein
MLPTILAFAGDRRPSAALGANLFGPPRASARSAVAVRPGGIRLDRDGYSVIVDARLPFRETTRPAFPGIAAPNREAPEVTADRLTAIVDTWSYLIEHNRVWNDALLKR